MGKITGPDRVSHCSITDSDEAQAQGLGTRPRHEAQAQDRGMPRQAPENFQICV